MAGSITDALEVDLLKLLTAQTTTIFTSTAFANVYVALCTTASTDAAAGTEVTGGSYARVDSKTKWGTPSGTTPSTVSNNATITFPTATVSWGTVTHFELWTAITSGTRLAWADLGTSKAVGVGDTPSFAAAALTITAD
jgi:hypothetical protein